jgi:hypothetical protein
MLTNSNFTYNLAFKSGVVQLESQANLTANLVSFYYNRAMTVGGVIVVLTDSYFNLVSCDFYYNQANQSSAIDALGSSLTENLQVTLSTFQ